ncbi:MAG: choice-of-anchor D domain-containing protein, partial [Bacteroidota bacterium]|nr:choice-of-anchor D domain-containing protein [Bacteroidota bacterium]
PAVTLLFLATGVRQADAQNIQTVLTVFDNVGNSTDLRIGINASASDGIDAGLGEVELPPYVPGNYDARLIDNDIRTPSILGNGVLKDLRGIFTPPPISQTFELRVRRDPGAGTTWMKWSLPLATGISSMRLLSYPNPAIVDEDMSGLMQVELPVGTNRYLIEVTYGDPPPTRYTLNVEINPPGKGQVLRFPLQPDYAPGTGVGLVALNLPAPDTCYRFSHWSGDASGTSNLLTVSMTKNKTIVANYAPRTFPVTVSELDTFVVTQNPPDPQKVHITNSGLDCYTWTATPTVPWLRLSKTVGSGNDSIEVEVITSAIPCPGTHAGTIALESDFTDPRIIEIPVILRIGRTNLSAQVEGSPSILSCQTRATELITVTLFNDGLNAVNFGAAPDLGEGFVLKNPAIFPLTLPSRDSVKMYVEFVPTATQRGTIIENVILSADACGQEVLFKLEAARIAPTVTADVFEIDFGLVNACGVDPLPQRDIVLENAHSQLAVLRYSIPSGFTLVNAPDSLPGGTSATVTIEPARLGATDITGVLGIEADFGICAETFSIDMFGTRQSPSFYAEAVDTPGMLPPQLYDTTCVGAYSDAKSIRIVNDGDAEMMMTITVAAPFEIDAFSNTFPLRPGNERIVPIRFHPTASGTFEETLTIAANLCDLETTVDLRGTTFSQQVLTSAVTPTSITLANCEPSAKMLLRVHNAGTEPVRFVDLPALPNGFAWDETLALPIVIPPDSMNPFEAYIRFEPPLGDGGSFGGSVQWFGEPCGSTVYFTLDGERILPQVSITPQALDFGEIISCGSASGGPGRVITVENNSPLPVTLNALAEASKYELRLGPIPFPTQGVEIAANDSREIDVIARPGGGGLFNDTLTLEIIAGTGGFCRETFPIALRGERYEPRFLVRENGYSTNFGDVCVDGNAVRGYIVENTGDKRLTVMTDGFSPLSPFQLLARPFKFTLEPGSYREFPIRYNPMQVGMDAATIFFTSDYCADSVAFTVRGRGVQPVFEVTSVSPQGRIEVLSCETSKSRQITATVSNTGPTPVTVTDGSLLPTGFAYDPPEQFPFTLQPSQTRNVVVRFTATEAGDYSGLVTLFGEPCDVQSAFPVSATVINSNYSLEPEALDFGDILICPDGFVHPEDLEQLEQVLTFRNTGAVPLEISGQVKPGNTPLTITSPLSWPMLVAPGQTQRITVALQPPFDERAREFSGVVEITTVRDMRCVPETRVVPFGGRLDRLSYIFASDTLSATATCATEPVTLQAELFNTGDTPLTLTLRIEGSEAFRLSATSPEVRIPPRESVAVEVLYTPTEGAENSATLYASEALCRSESSVAMTVDYERPVFALSAGENGGTAPQLSARPGDMVEIPVFVTEELVCEIEQGALRFELQFEGRALTPRRVISGQGNASFARTGANSLQVTVQASRFTAGPLVRMVMEVLVGPSSSTEWSITGATLEPDVAQVVTDEATSGTITIRPRNGVTTLSDLGITTMTPPRPNVLDGKSGRSTQVSITLDRDSFVEMKLYNLLGVETDVIHRGMLKQGAHILRYRADNLRPGVYFVVMTTGSFRSTQKLIIAN